MQTLVIGDIHGCYDEFQALLDKAGLTEGDAIISVGD
ncbi:MAG: serine/threonine protein phosphatase, partial [Anaerolineae bacterium]|nr:serine/threonine protein phosphatase [Anaerolineae bacterium]